MLYSGSLLIASMELKKSTLDLSKFINNPSKNLFEVKINDTKIFFEKFKDF